MEELFFLVTKRAPNSPIEVCGCVTRTAAHTLGFPHTSVLLVPVIWDRQDGQPVIVVHKRSPHKRTSPSTWDFCGGHLSFEDWYCRYLQSYLSPTHLIERIAEDTAVREANEELKCKPPFEFQMKHIYRFKAVGYFECDNKSERGHNVEFSTTFVVSVPNDRQVSVWDKDMEGERELEVKRFQLIELLEEYRKNPKEFADGAGRILEKLSNDNALQAELVQVMEELAKPKNK